VADTLEKYIQNVGSAPYSDRSSASRSRTELNCCTTTEICCNKYEDA